MTAPDPKTQSLELVHISRLRPHPANRRFDVKSEAFKSLVESIRAHGVMVPLIARMLNASDYQILAGHRRYQASQEAKLAELPVVVRDLDDANAKAFVVTENLQREDVSPLDAAAGIEALLADGWTYETIASRLGRSTSWVARRAQLTRLTPDWRKAIADPQAELSRWPAVLLERIASLPAETQDQVLADNGCGLNGPSPTVNDLDCYLALHFTRRLKSATWKLDDALLVPKAGPCTVCRKRSDAQPMLFGEGEASSAKAQCLDPACWATKAAAAVRDRVTELRAKHKKVILVNDGLYGKDKTAAEKQFGATLTSTWSLKTCKKSDPGAVPAITVSGPKAGQVTWVAGKGGRPTGSRQAGEAKPVRSLAELRAELERRRAVWVRDQVVEALNNLASDKTPLPSPINALSTSEVLDLVAAWGTDDGYGGSSPACEWACPNKDDSLKAWKKLQAESAGKATVLLVRRLFRVWSQFLEPVVISKAAAWNSEMEFVCHQTGIDLRALQATAEVEIPEPASWANRNADGTPKTIKTGPAPAKAPKAAKKPRNKGKAAAPSSERRCRECGCTEDNACDDKLDACHWVEANLCSACAGKPAPPGTIAMEDICSLHGGKSKPKAKPAAQRKAVKR